MDIIRYFGSLHKTYVDKTIIINALTSLVDANPSVVKHFHSKIIKDQFLIAALIVWNLGRNGMGV